MTLGSQTEKIHLNAFSCFPVAGSKKKHTNNNLLRCTICSFKLLVSDEAIIKYDATFMFTLKVNKYKKKNNAPKEVSTSTKTIQY